ncbi:MAG: DUF1707 SHOCT-like domain-containing protein [Solirubrobacteraceae bacterium]
MSGEVIRRGSRIRASDDDRELLISELREHAVAGRLTTEDLEQRVQAAYESKTLGELDQLRGDLPLTSGQRELEQTARRAHLTRRLAQESGGSLGVFVLCVGIWLASGANGQFWPVWVLVVFALSVVRNGWALYGPAPDLDAVEANLDAHRAKRLERSERRAARRGR